MSINTSTLLSLLAENRSRTTQLRLHLYINGCAQPRRFHFKRNPANSLSHRWPELRAARFPLLLNPLTFANDSINHYSWSILDPRAGAYVLQPRILYTIPGLGSRRAARGGLSIISSRPPTPTTPTVGSHYYTYLRRGAVRRTIYMKYVILCLKRFSPQDGFSKTPALCMYTHRERERVPTVSCV